MNIFEMLSFDFKEFVTSPAGILIILGIVCLLVGIVIFLKEGKKSAKATEAAETPAPSTTTEEVKKEETAPAVEAAPLEPVQEAAPVVVKATEDGVNEVPVPEVAETLNISETTPAAPEVVAPVVESLDSTATITPVVEAPVAPAPEAPAPVVETPVALAPEAPAPAVETPAAPEVVAPAVESLEEQPTVYGGASPEVTNVVAEEQPREIYGGANPLENTAPIPTDEVKVAVETPVAPAPEAPAPVAETPVAPEVAAPAPEAPKEEIEKLEF